jgi:hypothetical protein
MNLNDNVIDMAVEFFTGNTKKFDKKDEDFKNLLRVCASDCNSSWLRELVTLRILGYTQHPTKHGPDGYDPKTNRQKEVKPRYVESGSKTRLGGNFNDMTPELFAKKKNLDIICSTFVGDRLVCVVEFPFSVISDKIKQPIINAKLGKRVVCHFSHTSFQHSDELIIHYYDSETINNTKCYSAKVTKLLKGKYDSQLLEQKKLNQKSN